MWNQGERGTLVSKEASGASLFSWGFFTFSFNKKRGPKPRKTFWKSGNRKFQGNFYSETLRTSVFLKWSCSLTPLLGEIIILFPAFLPLSMAVTLINNSSVLSSPLRSGCVTSVCVCHRGGVCCMAKVPDSKPYGQWPVKSCPECHGSWWVSNIILFSHGPVSSCVAVRLQTISEWHWEVVKLPKQTPGTKPVFWLRIFVQTNGSKPVLAHIGCNSLNIINSLLTSYTHAQTKAVDKPGRDVGPPSKAQLQQDRAHRFLC